MKRFTKRFLRYSTYMASLAALGVLGWFGSLTSQNQDADQIVGGVLIQNAEADDVGSAGCVGDSSTSDGSGGDGGGGDGGGGGCSGGCSG